jgi:hypothetical protein
MMYFEPNSGKCDKEINSETTSNGIIGITRRNIRLVIAKQYEWVSYAYQSALSNDNGVVAITAL